jgi:hypothetical protein
MDYFRRLGAMLEDGWRDADRDEERLPDVAAAALDELPPGDHFDREAFLDAVLDPHEGGLQQLAPLHAFGQPGLTAFFGDGFCIEVYHWLDSVSAIHNHPFCGVFTVLEGWSVHARYATSVAVRAGAQGRLCDVRLRGLDLVTPGSVHRFSLKRHPLVHALIHVPVPSISMVIRTVRTEGYLRYLPPTIAIPMAAPSEPTARRIAMLEALREAGDPGHAARLERALRHADFETAVHLLLSVWPGSEPEQRKAWLQAIEPQHGDRIDAITRALERSLRLQEASAIRSRLRDADQRLCATALAYAESRRHVVELLEQRPGDPLARLHRFVDGADLFAPDEEPSRIIAHALVDGGGLGHALANLRQAYDAPTVEELRPEVERWCGESIFSVLAS